MKLIQVRELYVQPVQFRTISFHHQSDYFIRFQLIYREKNNKNILQAYPSIIQNQLQNNNFVTFKKVHGKNYAQTNKFHIAFNDQIVTMKGGFKFIVENQLHFNQKKKSKEEKYKNEHESQKNPIQQAELIISLWKIFNNNQKDHQQAQIETLISEKVGQEIININFNVEKDFSENTCYRHIAFTKNQYFCSLFFYIDFNQLSSELRSKSSLYHSQLNKLEHKLQIQEKTKMKKDVSKYFKSFVYNEIFNKMEIRNVYKILIQERLKQYNKIVQKLKQILHSRIKYIQNYENIQLQNIQQFKILKQSEHNINSYNLDHLYGQMDIVNLQSLKQCYETDNINQLYQLIYQDSKLINLNIRKIWNEIIHFTLQRQSEQFKNQALKYKIDKMMYVSKLYQTQQEIIINYDQKIITEKIYKHKQYRNNVCNNSKFYNKNQLKHSMITLNSQKKQLIISKTIAKPQYQILVILVHGLKGSNRDMAKIKSFINTFTSINFLSLQNLRKCPNEDIQTLGKSGADEIQQYLAKKPYITSINIIGFSLGGIISKAILRNLSHHKQKFNLFLTLSSPHLGISQIQSCLVYTGITWLKKVNKIKNMKQLCIEPLNKNSKKITLLQLSNEKVLSWFNHIVLIGSNQDSYVPKYSSLMCYNGSNKIVEAIQQNSLENIHSIDRITVWFEYQQSIVQKITGKKGHISFIEDSTFLEYIILKYLHFF